MVVGGLTAVMAVALAGAPGLAAPAAPAERAEVLLLGGAINRYLAKQLPLTFTLRGGSDAGAAGPAVTLVAARSCDAKDANRGRVVGVVRPAGTIGPAVALEAADCRRKPSEIARRLSSAPQADAGTDATAIAVVELIATWAPSELRVSIGDVAAGGDTARPLARSLARAQAAGPLATVDTGGLRLETERGSTLPLELALSFPKGGDGVLATLTVACADCVAAPPQPPFATPIGAPPDTDAIAVATLRFANRLAALFSGDGPLVLELDGHTFEIRGVQLEGGDGALSIRGRATARAFAETARVRIDAAGADLRLSEVRADPELDDCRAQTGTSYARCNLRNAARGPAAAALAAAMTARLRGRLVRALIAPPPFAFEVGGRRMTLRLTATRAAVHGGAVIVHGQAEVD